MAFFRKRTWQEELHDRLAHQMSQLRREVDGLGHRAGRYGSHLHDDADDFADVLWRGGRVAARQIGRQASKAGRAVKEDPVPAMVAVAGFALFLNLVLSRK
jgi:hypothetical protein